MIDVQLVFPIQKNNVQLCQRLFHFTAYDTQQFSVDLLMDLVQFLKTLGK